MRMELYKGQAGSPITYLAADISANQTTISIADDSALPDAPNICTIGYGEHLETIKYETKSNGVLQNVTRGIEGTPQAWQAGTEVARFFTAYDHNSIIDNFVAHKAESAEKHIHSSGGNYIKFDDGTMICYANLTLTYKSARALRVSWTFPEPFLVSPVVTFTVGTTNDITPLERDLGLQQTSPITTKYATLYQNIGAGASSSFLSGDTMPAYAKAIGRWK